MTIASPMTLLGSGDFCVVVAIASRALFDVVRIVVATSSSL